MQNKSSVSHDPSEITLIWCSRNMYDDYQYCAAKHWTIIYFYPARMH